MRIAAAPFGIRRVNTTPIRAFVPRRRRGGMRHPSTVLRVPERIDDAIAQALAGAAGADRRQRLVERGERHGMDSMRQRRRRHRWDSIPEASEVVETRSIDIIQHSPVVEGMDNGEG